MKILIAGDFHVPFHDPRAVAAFLSFAREYRPDQLVLHGDVVDFEALSRFLKDPDDTEKLQDSLDQAREIISALKAVCGWRVFGIGNHEHRLEAYLFNHAPALAHLDALCIANLIGLDGWRIVPYDHYYRRGRLVVLHGTSYGTTVARKNAAKFAGFDVVQGHSHRLSQIFLRSLHGTHSSVEAGCLCDLSPKYTYRPDWQQGFATYDGVLRIHPIVKGQVR